MPASDYSHRAIRYASIPERNVVSARHVHLTCPTLRIHCRFLWTSVVVIIDDARERSRFPPVSLVSTPQHRTRTPSHISRLLLGNLERAHRILLLLPSARCSNGRFAYQNKSSRRAKEDAPLVDEFHARRLDHACRTGPLISYRLLLLGRTVRGFCHGFIMPETCGRMVATRVMNHSFHNYLLHRQQSFPIPNFFRVY